MVSKRRRADDEDDLSLFLGDPSRSTQDSAEVVDELGRVVASENPTVARRDRMTARGGRRLLRRVQTRSDEEEGYSTDDTLPPSDAADFETAMENLLAKGKDVLSDVRAKDFKNPEQGLSKWFGEWRDKFGDSYTGAWGGLGMVGGWEFWTRLEMLGWNPLEVTDDALNHIS
jgi:GC-rich sequence DNA-binding factor